MHPWAVAHGGGGAGQRVEQGEGGVGPQYPPGMASAMVQRSVDRLSEDLGRSVVVVDPEIRLLHASRHFGDEDPVRVQAILRRDAGSRAIGHVLGQGVRTWTRLGRITGAPELGLRSRLCAPVRWHGQLLAFVMVIDDGGSVTSVEQQRISALADDLAPALAGEAASSAAVRNDRERMVARLVGPDAAERAQAIAQLARLEPAARAPWVRAVVVRTVPATEGVDVDLRDAALRHAVATGRRPRGFDVVSWVRDGHGVFLQFAGVPVEDGDAVGYAEHLLREVDDFGGGHVTGSAGIGEMVAGAGRAWGSYRQARLACRAIGVLGRGAVARWGELGVLQVLLRIPPDELDETAVPPALETLAASDPHGVLVRTLDAFLRHGGAAVPTADALHVHRTTLYYRLDRIRAVTGADLDDGETRLLLQLGLAVRQLIAFRQGEEGAAGGSSPRSW